MRGVHLEPSAAAGNRFGNVGQVGDGFLLTDAQGLRQGHDVHGLLADQGNDLLAEGSHNSLFFPFDRGKHIVQLGRQSLDAGPDILQT